MNKNSRYLLIFYFYYVVSSFLEQRFFCLTFCESIQRFEGFCRIKFGVEKRLVVCFCFIKEMSTVVNWCRYPYSYWIYVVQLPCHYRIIVRRMTFLIDKNIAWIPGDSMTAGWMCCMVFFLLLRFSNDAEVNQVVPVAICYVMYRNINFFTGI